MKTTTDRRHLFDDLRNVRRLIAVLLVCCAVLLLLDLVAHRHASFEGGELGIETWFGFWAFYGFVACVLLVLLAKEMRRVLRRPEDYYGPPQPIGDAEVEGAGGAPPSGASERNGGGHDRRA